MDPSSTTSTGAALRHGSGSGYGYYNDPASFAPAGNMPTASTLQYQTAFNPNQQHATLGSDMMYQVAPGIQSQGQLQQQQGLQPHVPQGRPYDAMLSYQQQSQLPRHSAAVEALSSQFAAAAPQYFMPSEPTQSTNTGLQPQPEPAAQFPALGYSEASSGFPIQQPYTASLTTPTPAPGGLLPIPSEQESGQAAAASHDEALEQHQLGLRQTFAMVRADRLAEAGQMLRDNSEWLLEHVVELGPSLHSLPRVLRQSKYSTR
jgi:hypothetical protein